MPVRTRRFAEPVATTAAIVVLVLAPALPGALAHGSTAPVLALVVLPFESVAAVLLLTALPSGRLRRVVAAVFGLLVVTAIVLAALDLAFRSAVDRSFDAADGKQVIDAYGVVRDAVGPVTAVLVVALLVAVLAGSVVLVAWAALRMTRIVTRSGARGRAAMTAVAAVWAVSAVVGARLVPGVPFAAAPAVGEVAAMSARTADALRELAEFDRRIRADAARDIPSGELFAALRGKDVVIAFLESYGRVALDGTESSADVTSGVDRVLRDGEAQLARDGYEARSAFLTSPTFGGVSWLAHATLQTGLWVDSQLTHDRTMASDRLTLSQLFGSAGWRTVSVVPSNTGPWPEGTGFYGFDELLNAENVGYRGPAFGYARVPDQYTWKHFADTELIPPHAPVMAEIDLVSSHTPWTPLPRLLDWSAIGDGSVYGPQAAEGKDAAEVWRDPRDVQRMYGTSIEYSLGAMLSFLARARDGAQGDDGDARDLVLIVLGDHQPARIVSGPDASHEVPVSIIADDPAVLARIASWGWDAGLRPSADAPVWRMDAFRDRFVDAFRGE